MVAIWENEGLEGEIVARYEGVSPSVIRRLPRYYRFLEDLQKKDVHRISSRELSQLMNLTASQIRQDLNCFGGFGQQGYGYNVDALLGEIGNILGLHKGYKVILIGAGNLGLAIAKEIVEQHEGKIALASEYGKGTTVTITLPTDLIPNREEGPV